MKRGQRIRSGTRQDWLGSWANISLPVAHIVSNRHLGTIGRAVVLSILAFFTVAHSSPVWASSSFSPAAQLVACNPATDVGGIVFRDYNVNGVQDVGEPGIDGSTVTITATAYGTTNQVLGSANVQSDGSYVITGANLSAGARIEFSGLPSWLQPGPKGSNSGTLVQFVSGASCIVDLGVNNPSDFCQDNPALATTCFVGGDPLGGGNSADGDVLVTWAYDESGWWFNYPTISTGGANMPTKLAINSEMGPAWGIAYQRSTQTIFSSALLKRHAGFGPLGPGGIYAVDNSNPAAPVVQQFLDLNTLATVNVGTDPRTAPLPADAGVTSIDAEAHPLIAKMSIGDIDISDDEQTLYIMNLNNNGELIALDIASKSVTAQVAIPDPGCLQTEGTASAPAPEDRRPWAVDVHDGQVYVGVVCSAQSSQNADDLHAYVMQLTGNTFTTVFDFALTYPKGMVSAGKPDSLTRTGWFPWTDNFATLISADGLTLMYPQPILSDIEFDDDGSMILGFMDRTGHMGGRENRSTDPNDGTLYNAHSGGDLLRVCNVNGAFVLEGGVDCPSNSVATGEGPGGGEFYPRDEFDPSEPGGLVHHETSLGSLALLPGSGEVVSTHFDAVRHVPEGENDPEPRTGGVRFHSNTDGTLNHSYEVYPDTDNALGTFAKAAGLGDLELICLAAPIEIGNYVWLDSDNDGIQDPGETPLVGVTVELVNSGGQVIATAITDGAGQYYFSSAAGTSTTSMIYNVTGLTPSSTGYVVRIPLNQAVLAGLEPSVSNAGGLSSNDNKLDLNDSDGISDGVNSAVTFATGAAGENNHNFDFGFTSSIPGIDIEKLTNGNQADGANDPDVPEIAPGDPVTWTYIVTNDGDSAVARELITVTDDIIGDLMVAGVVQTGVTFANEPDATLDPTDTWTFTVVQTAPDLSNPAETVGMTIVDGCNPTQQPTPGARETYENIATVTIPGDSDSDPSHFCNPRPGIDIEKLTNGNQADGANDTDVPEIAAGDPVTWSYIVTNDSTVSIPQSDITVTDDIVGNLMVAGVVQPGVTFADNGDGDAVLAPAEAWTLTVTQTAPDLSDPAQTVGLTIVDGCNPSGNTVPGARETYENIATVTIPGDSDSDPSHFCNPRPGIDIEKLTNGNQADGANDADVPEIAPGDPVIWSYIVTNDSQEAIPQADISVSDDIIGAIMVNGVVQSGVTFVDNGDGDAVLAPAESWTFTVQQIAPDLSDSTQTVGMTIVDGCAPATGTGPGSRETYENIATVTIPGDSDSDPSHYCNSIFDLALRKVLGAGQAREVTPGDTVTFTIQVANQGTVTATNIEVTDYVPAGLTLNDPNWNGSGELVTRTIPGPLTPGVTTTVDIVFTVNPNVQPGDLINLAEISDHEDEEGRKPTDKDSTPDKDRNNDGTPKDNVVNEDRKRNPTDDEDDHDPERLTVPAMSLGNRVWLDIGGGSGGVVNDGLINGDEEGIANVQVNLLTGAGSPVLGSDSQPRTSTTDADGYYRFDNLPPGQYIVCLDASNFVDGGALTSLRSTTTSEPDPNSNGDSNDNGIDGAQSSVNGICSNVVTLTFDSEPLNEPDPNTGGSDILDVNTNLTVDFGFVPIMSLGNRIWLDNGAGGGSARDGLINGAEVGIANVKVNLFDASGNPVLDADGNPLMTNTDEQGYYRFENLLPGQYIVCVDATNFAVGAPLNGLSSTTTSEANPDDDGDSNDNGVNAPDPGVNGVCSNVVNLVFFTEPMNEPDPSPVGSDSADDNNNLTVDFGFVAGPTSLDEGEEPGAIFDRFIYLPLTLR